LILIADSRVSRRAATPLRATARAFTFKSPLSPDKLSRQKKKPSRYPHEAARLYCTPSPRITPRIIYYYDYFITIVKSSSCAPGIVKTRNNTHIAIVTRDFTTRFPDDPLPFFPPFSSRATIALCVCCLISSGQLPARARAHRIAAVATMQI